MTRKPSQLIFGVEDIPPPATSFLLGVQHVFIIATSFIFPVIVVRAIQGTNAEAAFFVSMTMLAIGIGTILQAISRKGVGSGFLCPSYAAAFTIPTSIEAITMGGFALLATVNVLGGVIQTVLSKVLVSIRSLFPTEVTGLVVVMAGVSIIPIAMKFFFRTTALGIELTPFWIAVLTIGVIIGLSVWGKGILRLFSVFVGVAAGYMAAIAAGLLGPNEVLILSGAPLLSLPHVPDLSLALDPRLLLLSLLMGLAGTFKAIGDLTSCEKINDPAWNRPDMERIGRGVFAQGVSVIASGLLGGMAPTTSSSNIGLSLATGATSRYIALVAGAIVIICAFIPVIAGFFILMPEPVIGAIMIYAAAFLVVTGFQILTSRMMDIRRVFVVGLSFIFGLSVLAVPDLFRYISHPLISGIVATPLTLATTLAVCLTLIFRIGGGTRVTLEVSCQEDTGDVLFPWMEGLGEEWGARREVVTQASFALTAFFEWATLSGAVRGPATVEARFDEYNLDITVLYHGRPLVVPDGPPTEDEILAGGAGLSQMAGFLIGRYADRVTTGTREGRTSVIFHFTH
ncbi:MAG: purine/pyrimidine permease [Methanomicrobiales archaeon]|nr:purine/pyrimidine permease [Methanomicrobiales archaeon]